jgi:hypothetical protein
MGLYEGIKDVAKVIQKADNVELYRQLIDLSAQALDMQNEISRLSAENTELKKLRDIDSRIERHQEPYITLKDDPNQILFCSHCWDYEQKLIQVKCYNSGKFKCTHCDNEGIYDTQKHEASIQNTRAVFQVTRNNRHSW